MNHDRDPSPWKDLPHEMSPPPELEQRVTDELHERGLLRRKESSVRRRLWAAAAAVALLAAGFLLGRSTHVESGSAVGSVETAPGKYALLLYETEGYDRPSGPEAVTRYGEYSRWVAEASRREDLAEQVRQVAEARARGQFVTGEDLRVDEGRVIAPGKAGPRVEPGVEPGASAPLSGVFVITARDYEHAVSLAAELPHLTHGGRVVVQRIVPTEQPPRVGNHAS